MSRIPVAVVGATGLAGQQFLASLAEHPQFEIRKLAASSRSAGKKYSEAVKDDKGASKWFCGEPLAAEHADIVVEDSAKMTTDGVGLVFSAVEADVARELEPRCAEKVPVISTASAFRYEADVPVFLPGVNWDHAALIDVQRKRRGWKGFVSPGPNCTTVGLAMTLRPLDVAFGVNRVIMTSMQALSGAGRSPGVGAMDILDNIIPYIPKEEEKVQVETLKILGKVSAAGDVITPANMSVSCTCTRVNVLEGHTESVFVELRKKARTRRGQGGLARARRRSRGPRAPLGAEAPHHRHRRSVPPAGAARPRRGGRHVDRRGATARGHGARQRRQVPARLCTTRAWAPPRGAILVAEYLTKKGYIG